MIIDFFLHTSEESYDNSSFQTWQIKKQLSALAVKEEKNRLLCEQRFFGRVYPVLYKHIHIVYFLW